MSRQWTWYHPESLEEASRILADHGKEAMLVAGGTALALSPPRRDELHMIDLSRAGADGIEREGEQLRLGPMVTPEALVKCDLLDLVGSGMLREAGRTVGPRPVRNRATVGGNVMRAFPWSDLPVPLLALGASFELLRARAPSRTITADELFASQPRLSREKGEVLSAVHLSVDRSGEGGAFLKFTATAVEHALCSMAVRLRLDGEACVEARAVAGAVAALPQRLTGVEEALVGLELDDAKVAKAAEAARSAKVVRDRRGDDEYRRELCVVLARRAIRLARDRALGRAEA